MPDLDLIGLLDVALDALVAARIKAGALPPAPVLDEGLEQALRADDDCQAALREHRAVFDRLVGAVPPGMYDVLVSLSDAATRMSVA